VIEEWGDRVMWRSTSAVAFLVVGALVQLAAAERLIMSCQTTFTPDASAVALARRFGARNVKSASISLGEGGEEEGTLLFPQSPMNSAEILWKDVRAKKFPKSVRIQAYDSDWRSPEGLALGATLRAVETINRRPFRLSGCGWD
jgi:hypothetical protein